MNIKTGDGIDIYCLPESALCKCENKKPSEMDTCPARMFDDFGDLCIPELCENYDEEEGRQK